MLIKINCISRRPTGEFSVEKQRQRWTVWTCWGSRTGRVYGRQHNYKCRRRVRHDLVTKSPPYSLASNLVSHQISHSLMGPEMCPEPQASWLKSWYSIYIHTLNPASHAPNGWYTTVNDQVDTKFTLRLTPLLQILLPYPTNHLGCPQIPTTSCAKCEYHTLLDTAHRTARGHTQTTDQPMAQFPCIHPQPTHILIHVAEVPACLIWVCLCFVRNPG